MQYLDAGRLCARGDGHPVCARLAPVEPVVLPAEVRHRPAVPAVGGYRRGAAEAVPRRTGGGDRRREPPAAQLAGGGEAAPGVTSCHQVEGILPGLISVR